MREFYSKFQEKLNLRQIELLKLFNSERTNLSEQVMTSPGDAADLSSVDSSADYFARLSNQHRDEILEVKNALKRLHIGTYGICEQCEEEIEVRRLNQLPYARLCVDCKKKNERRTRPHVLQNTSFQLGKLGNDVEPRTHHVE